MEYDFHSQAPKSVCQIISFAEPFDVDTPFVYSRPGSAKGTGFIIDVRGVLMVVTAAHVIHFAQDVVCVMPNGKADRHKLKIVHILPDFDIAILGFVTPPEGTVPMQLGNDEELRLGKKIYALGYPLGDQQLKVVPAHFNGRRQWLQIDGAMNPGISGGPITQSDGRVVGLVAKGIAPEKVNNVTEAVFITAILNIFHLIDPKAEKQIISLIQLGIRVIEPTKTSIELWYNNQEGAQIRSICSISPFFSDLKANDLLTKIDLTLPNGTQQSYNVDRYGMVKVKWQMQPLPVTYVFDKIIPGSAVVLHGIHKGGAAFSISKKFPNDLINSPPVIHPFLYQYAWTMDPSRYQYIVFGGMVLQNMGLELAVQFKYTNSPSFWFDYNEPAVIISYVLDSTELGKNRSMVRPGDVITHINGKRVQNVQEANESILLQILKNPSSLRSSTQNKKQKKRNFFGNYSITSLKLPSFVEFKTKTGIDFILKIDEPFIQNEAKQADKWGCDEKILFQVNLDDVDFDSDEENKPSKDLAWVDREINDCELSNEDVFGAIEVNYLSLLEQDNMRDVRLDLCGVGI